MPDWQKKTCSRREKKERLVSAQAFALIYNKAGK